MVFASAPALEVASLSLSVFSEYLLEVGGVLCIGPQRWKTPCVHELLDSMAYCIILYVLRRNLPVFFLPVVAPLQIPDDVARGRKPRRARGPGAQKPSELGGPLVDQSYELRLKHAL